MKLYSNLKVTRLKIAATRLMLLVVFCEPITRSCNHMIMEWHNEIYEVNGILFAAENRFLNHRYRSM